MQTIPWVGGDPIVQSLISVYAYDGERAVTVHVQYWYEYFHLVQTLRYPEYEHAHQNGTGWGTLRGLAPNRRLFVKNRNEATTQMENEVALQLPPHGHPGIVLPWIIVIDDDGTIRHTASDYYVPTQNNKPSLESVPFCGTLQDWSMRQEWVKPTIPIPWTVVFSVAYQLWQVLDYLHRVHHVIHHDICGRNILVRVSADSVQIVLCDFGVAERMDQYGHGALSRRTFGTSFLPEHRDVKRATVVAHVHLSKHKRKHAQVTQRRLDRRRRAQLIRLECQPSAHLDVYSASLVLYSILSYDRVSAGPSAFYQFYPKVILDAITLMHTRRPSRRPDARTLLDLFYPLHECLFKDGVLQVLNEHLSRALFNVKG